MTDPSPFLLARKFLAPLLVAIVLGIALYFGGQSYQVIGLAALDRLREVLAYGLGIAEITVLAVLVHRFIRYIVLDGLVARALGTPVPALLVQLSGLIVLAAAAAAVFGIVFQQELTVLWAASGVLGLVFGMALKDMILDVFTGIALNLDRPIRIGDTVQLHRTGDQVIEGKVMEISWRATRLLDDFGNVVIIPNSRLGAATITNFSVPEPVSWIIVPVTLDAEVPPERAVRILEAAAVEAVAPFAPPGAPSPFVGAKGLTSTGVEYSVCLSVPVDKRIGARNAVVQQVWKHLNQAGLKPSWPKLARIEATPAPRDALTPAEVALLIAATPLFQDLPAPALAELARAAPTRALPAGAVLVQAGEAATTLHLILEGLVLIESGRSQGNRKGAPPRLQGPGGLIGSQAVLLTEGYAETVRCRTAVRAAEIDRALLGRLLAVTPALAPALARRLADEMHASAQPATAGRRLVAADGDLAGDILAGLRRTFPGVPIA
ncbi:MAG: mechanosensitive ion channel family protein [Rhodospirillaceae bacterium]